MIKTNCYCQHALSAVLLTPDGILLTIPHPYPSGTVYFHEVGLAAIMHSSYNVIPLVPVFLYTRQFLEMNTSSDSVTRQLDKTPDQRMLQELMVYSLW